MSSEAFFILLAILSALALFVIFEVIRIWWYLGISKRLTSATSKFERHNPDATKRILFIGDSYLSAIVRDMALARVTNATRLSEG